jgi:Tol biopolymer transport system component
VFGEHGKNVRTLYRVSQMGGDVRQLLYDVDSPVSFSPDGKQIAFIRGFFKEREKALFVAAADGSGETRLSTRKAPEFTAMDEPAWSPDGTRIAFIVGGVDSEGYYINIDAVAIQDKTESKISSDRWRNISSIAWLSDSSGLIASARERAAIAGSPEQIWRISSPDGAAQQLTTDLNYYSSVSIADSNKVVATVRNQEAHIWVAPTGNSEKARQISTNSFSGLWGLAWAPDGRLVYTASERENRDIWISNADGSNEKQLTFETAADLNPFVSPDSRYIVFLSNRGVGWGIWRMHLNGTNPKELVRNIQEYGIPMVSRDSRWVIYSADNAGRPALWKISIDGGTPVLLADKHLYGATLSPDGKSIAYYYRPPELGAVLQIEIISSEGGAPYKTFPAPGDGYRMRWSPDGSAIDYVHTREGVSNLWRVPINGGQPKQLTNWTAEQIFWFAWSDDGKTLGCARGAFLSDLVLIENLNVVQ